MRISIIGACRTGLTLGVLLIATSCQRAPQSVGPHGNWISLFNGQNLEGWAPKFAGHPLGHNLFDTFRVRDGKLVVSYDNYPEFRGEFGHLLYVDKPFSHYWIRAEYRFVGEQVPGAPAWAWRNNGLMLHTQPPETMALDQEQPVSIEVRLLGGAWSGRRPTANLCLIKTSAMIDRERQEEGCHESNSATHRGDRWVVVEAEVRGAEVVRHFVNGQQVLEYSDIQLTESQSWLPSLRLSSGHIAIQAETHPTEFRRIDVLSLGD